MPLDQYHWHDLSRPDRASSGAWCKPRLLIPELMTGNPFAADIYPDGCIAEGGAAALHSAAIGDLKRHVERAGQRSESGGGGGGTVVLLRAPRAGFGKSHLLARTAAELGDRAFVLNVPIDREREVLWSALLWQTVQSFHERRTGELTLLDLVTRRIFAIVNQRMIVEKRIPCAHPQEALSALEDRFVELFDFANPEQAVARWFAEHFERLLPFAARAIGQIAGLSEPASAHWLRVLCAYAQGRPDGESVRWESLRWALAQPAAPAVAHGVMNVVSAGTSGEAGARERMTEFCRIAGAVRPLVMVFDDLDLFHQQMAAAQRIAGCIAELRRLLPRAVQVLSVNQDLWSQTFLCAVPSAIEDRLTGSQITLGTITRDEATQLVRARLTPSALSEVVVSAFLHRLNLAAWFSQEAGRLVSPRAVLRYAARVWDEERSAHDHAAVNGRAATVPEIPDMIPSVPLKVADAPVFRAPLPETRPAPAPFAPREPELEAEPFIDTLPGDDPAFARLRESLQRLLTPLPAEETAYTPPEFITDFGPAADTILTGPATADETTALHGRHVEPPAPAPSSGAILQRRFQQLRAHFLTAPWLAVDQERLFHLLKSAGRRLAVVRWVDYPLPGAPGQSAGAWLGPDGETLFGSEPYEDHNYWSSLVYFTRERSGYGFTTATRPGVSCRLVVFSSGKAPVNLAAWMPPDEIIDARTHFLDVKAVDQPVLATLYAADEMMRDAERGALGVSPAETFSMLLPHLEFLWKEVTRPLKV
jgi:hypothetical protein